MSENEAAQPQPAPKPIATNITDLIGATPLLDLGAYTANRGLAARLLGKVEYFNPVGSVKDRIAWAIIRDAEEKGQLQPGGLVVDITSGNTGIALAAIAASRGYRTKFYLGDNTSPDKRRILEIFGSELVPIQNSIFLDPAAIEKLFQQVEEENPGAFIASQLANPANPAEHYASTGPELWADTDGAIDILVAGVGTGGTASGAGKFLKERKPGLQVVIVEPDGSSVPTEENVYPAEIDGVHQVRDIERDFLPPNYDPDIADEVLQIPAVDSYATARALAKEIGLLVGPSSGATVWAATQLAQRPENAGKTIVAVLPDTGERYLNAPGVFFPEEARSEPVPLAP